MLYPTCATKIWFRNSVVHYTTIKSHFCCLLTISDIKLSSSQIRWQWQHKFNITPQTQIIGVKGHCRQWGREKWRGREGGVGSLSMMLLALAMLVRSWRDGALRLGPQLGFGWGGWSQRSKKERGRGWGGMRDKFERKERLVTLPIEWAKEEFCMCW